MAVCPSFIEYVTWFALLCCASGILYEVYEKYVEYKILEEVEHISGQLLKIVPSALLDAIPAMTPNFTHTMRMRKIEEELAKERSVPPLH